MPIPSLPRSEMSNYFTKGPWNIGEINPLNRMQINPSIGYVYIDPDNPEEGEANARLIAAAPKMYEVIKSFIQISNNDDGQKCFRQAEELLAKIDGHNEGGK